MSTLSIPKRMSAVVALAMLLVNQELLADDVGALQRLPISAADIASVTGLNVYKFRVPMKEEAEFDVVISEQSSPDSAPRILHRHRFTNGEDSSGTEIRLSFMPRDDTFRGVLLSQDDEVEFRVDCPSCSPTGLATNIELPLRSVPGTRKTLVPMNSESSRKMSGDSEVCLIAILASGDRGVALKSSYPRARVFLKFIEHGVSSSQPKQ